MAVYTRMELAELAELTAPLGLGHLVAARGIAEGVENTTYFLSFNDGSSRPDSEYVLTIAESIARADIEFVAQLTTRLAHCGLPVPAPLADTDGTAVLNACGKPALLVPRAAGSHPDRPTTAQCRAIGDALARCHVAAQQSGFSHPSHRSLRWVAATARELHAGLTPSDRELISVEIERLSEFASTYTNLPTAVIHGDLFRDNALFEHDRLTAIIDFYSAGDGFLMFDLAVVANDWCFRTGTDPLPLLDAYAAARLPTPEERRLWPEFLALAALRFWVSRLADADPDPSAPGLRHTKNPDEFRDLLLQHRHSPQRWPR